MSQLERRAVDTIVKYRGYLYLFVISLISLFSRFSFRAYSSEDMSYYLLPWFEQIQQEGGLNALSHQVGDYNIFYQFIIALFTYFPKNISVFHPQYLYKYLSIFFDYLLAALAGCMAAQFRRSDKLFWFSAAYTAVIMLPTVVLNSSMWGQCDSIFTFFLMASLYAMLNRRDFLCFILFGLSLVFKFQAIFLLPFFVLAYFYFRRFSITFFALPPLVLWLSGFPAFLYGRSLLAPFTIYLQQSVEYPWMYANLVNFWMFLGDYYAIFSKYAICFTLVILGIGLYAVLSGYIKLDSTEGFLAAAAWCLWTCVLFLPAMHERYYYSRDILLILLVFLDWKYWKYTLPELCFSTISYGNYFFGTEALTTWHLLISLGLYTCFCNHLLSLSRGSSEQGDRS